MIRRPPRSTRTDTLVPDTTLFRSGVEYSKQSGLLYGDRFGGFRNTIPNPDNISSTDGIPALSVVDDSRFAVFTEGGLPYFDSGAAGLLGVDGPGVRAAERGVGKECVRTCRSRGSSVDSKKKKKKNTQ